MNTLKAFRCDLRDQVRSANNILAVNLLTRKNDQTIDNKSSKQNSSENRSNSLTQTFKPTPLPSAIRTSEILFDDENGQFVFNVPGATKNEAVWLEKLKETEELTSKFMNQAQECSVNNIEDPVETALSNVITRYNGRRPGRIDRHNKSYSVRN